jgi:Dual specificity phosphatase, catalytic domain
MMRIRASYRYTGSGFWSAARDRLRWLLRLPLRLLRRRDHRQLHAAMEQLSPRLLAAEASIYWIHPPAAGTRPALGGMREPSSTVLEQLPTTSRYLLLNLRESEAPVFYELPDRERFRAIRFPIAGGTLPERDAVLRLFERLAEFIEESAALPPALLVHCKEGISRTPQILCAWLAWREHLPLEDAVSRVQEAQQKAGVYLFVPDGRERGWIRGFEI